MSVRIFGRKALALVLSLAILASCMVFSFSVSAAMVLMWENDFDDTTGPWYSVLGGESDKGNFNSGTVGRTDVTAGNYAVYNEGGYMELGFTTWNSRTKLSGFTVRHKAATTKGETDGYGAGGAAVYRTGDGAFSPTAGKYKIELDYMLNEMVDDASTIIDICVGFANAESFFWDGAKDLATFTNDTNDGVVYTAASVTLADAGMDWKSVTLYVDIEETADRSMYIFVSNRNEGSNPVSRVSVDNIKVSRYDGVQDLDPDPTLVSTKMWENHFDNGTDSNWMERYTGSWKSNAMSCSDNTSGNYVVYQAGTASDGYMEFGFGSAEAAENKLSGMVLFHQNTTHTTAGEYGYKGGYPYSANAKGTFGPEAGKKYAVLLDYTVSSFSADTTSSVDICVGYSKEAYWETDRTLDYFTKDKKGVYSTVATVGYADVAKGEQRGAAYFEVPETYTDTMMHMFVKVSNNDADNLTNAVIAIDNIEIYEYENDLPTVTFYKEGEIAGVTPGGLPGAPLVMPDFTGVDMSSISYFSDEACTMRIDAPTVYPNASISVYMKAIPVEETTTLTIPDGNQAIYECEITNAGSVTLTSGAEVIGLFALADGTMTILGKTQLGSYGGGVYTVRAYINPVQDMLSVEVTLPDGGKVRRGNAEVINDYTAEMEVYATATAADHLSNVTAVYESVALNEYEDPRTTEEPVYEGFDANVYNLITSYDVDGKTTRSFAFTTVQDFAADSGMSLQYRVKDAAVWTTVTAEQVVETGVNTVEDHFKVDLTGLTAGTTYEYRIGKTGSEAADEWSDVYSFTTEAADVSDFSFIVYGDSQARAYWNFNGNESVAASQEYKRFADTRVMLDEAFQDESNPAFLLHLGDIVDSGEKLAWWKMFFKALGDYGKTTPHFALAGNHDVQTIGSGDAVGLPFNYYFNHPNNGGNDARDMSYASQLTTDQGKIIMQNSDEMIYSYDYGDAHIVVLNTGEDNTAAADFEALHKSQRDWLVRDLEANKDAKWTIVVVHRPIYSTYGDSKSFSWLSDTIESYDVDLVLQAHDHIYGRTYPMKNGEIVTKQSTDTIEQGSGTVYAMLSATCAWNGSLGDNNPEKFASIYAFEDNVPTSTYAVIDISGDELTMTTKKIDGLVVDSFTITANDRSTVSFYDGDNVLGHSVGDVGDTFVMPTLSGLPANAEFKYYADKACTQEIVIPTTYPAQSMNIYVSGTPETSTAWSFETEAVGTHLSAKASNVYQGGNRQVTNAYAHTGAQSMLMNNENGDDQANARRNQFVLKDGNGNYAQVRAGKNYLLTYWILVPTDAPSAYQGNLWLAGIGDSTAGVMNTGSISGYFFDDSASGYVTVPADGMWHQVSRYIDGTRITTDNDGNVLVGMTHMTSDSTLDVYLDDIELICVSSLVTGGYASHSDREQYLFEGVTATGAATHLHTHSTLETGIYTSVRLGATYTAADADADSIILGGNTYSLLERGMVVDAAANKSALDADNYKWKSAKKSGFGTAWDIADSATDGAKDVTYTFRLANISHAQIQADTKYVYRSYYKIAVPYYAEGAADTTVNSITVYGNVSDAFSFLDIYNSCSGNGTDGIPWFQ